MKAIPFSIENAWSVFGECTGLLHDDGIHLCLEFETSLFWIYKTGVRTVKVPVAEIADVKYEKQLLHGRIVIQTTRLALLQNVPGARQGRVELTIARADRAAAEQFVTGLYIQDQEASKNLVVE